MTTESHFSSFIHSLLMQSTPLGKSDPTLTGSGFPEKQNKYIYKEINYACRWRLRMEFKPKDKRSWCCCSKTDREQILSPRLLFNSLPRDRQAHPHWGGQIVYGNPAYPAMLLVTVLGSKIQLQAKRRFSNVLTFLWKGISYLPGHEWKRFSPVILRWWRLGT